VPFKEIDVSRDSAAAEEMVNLTGQMGVPVIVIDGQAIVGFDRNRIQELVSAGAGASPKIRFGLKIADASANAPQMGINAAPGAIIGEVSPGLSGKKAGLKPGDIVTEINGRKIVSAADMESALGGLQSGNIVTILFLRAGQTKKSEIIV
jgi:S1-C subfamily serine protease